MTGISGNSILYFLASIFADSILPLANKYLGDSGRRNTGKDNRITAYELMIA